MESAYWSAALATVHYLALGFGFWGISERTVAAKRASASPAMAREYFRLVLRGDNIWGIAAVLWILSGLLRAFGGYEKASEFYLKNGYFHLKMSLFLLVFAIEIGPMIRLIRARFGMRRYPDVIPLDGHQLRSIFRVGMIEIHLLTLIIALAALMARGIWLFE
jgi:putative membrane protein